MIDRRTFLAAAIVERSDNSAAEPPVRFAAHAAVGLLVAKTFA